MANKPIEARIRCPFYLHSTENRICCEGFLSGTSMITSFADKKNAAAHMKACCFLADGGSCHFAKMLFQKYK